MKPGAIAWPPTSTTASAAPDSLPISTILPSLTATSPWNDAIPEPSTTRPFLIKTSYAILCSSCSRSVVVASTIALGAGGRRLRAAGAPPRPGLLPLGRDRNFYWLPEEVPLADDVKAWRLRAGRHRGH